jgi:hypothetical protein
MCKRDDASKWGFVYLSIMMALYICNGVYVWMWSTQTASLIMIDNSFANSVASDWN